jgi:hypothetical protein
LQLTDGQKIFIFVRHVSDVVEWEILEKRTSQKQVRLGRQGE